MRMLPTVAVSVVALLSSISPAQAATADRLDLAQAMGIITDDACRQAFGDDADAVQACLDEDVFGVKGRTSADMVLEDDENKTCVELGGVLSARMAECVSAMRDVAIAETDDNAADFLRALGDATEFCSTQWLCIE